MPEVVPAVLAETPEDYEKDLNLAVSLSDRIQVDLVDGEFAQNRTINLIQSYWPEGVCADLHLMYEDPFPLIPTIISLKPHLAIVHAEASAMTLEALSSMRTQLNPLGIKLGLALLGPTTVASAERFFDLIDHVLVFTGELGHYGGELDSGCLAKISEIKSIDSGIEVGVDGGINDITIKEVVAAGADVFNVGGFLQKSDDPKSAYDKLTEEINR